MAATAALDEHFNEKGAVTNAQRKTEAQRLDNDTIFIYGGFEKAADGKVSAITRCSHSIIDILPDYMEGGLPRTADHGRAPSLPEIC